MENSTVSLKYFKITALAFAICFVLAAVFYLMPYSGKVKFIDFNEAKKKAAETNKPVYVSFYARWNVLSKTTYKSLYSNDTLADFLNRNTIPVIFAVDDENGENLAQETFGIDQFTQPIILDKYGRFFTGLYYADVNSFMNELTFVLNDPFLKMNDFNDGIEKAKESVKPLVLFVAESPQVLVDPSVKEISNLIGERQNVYNFATMYLFSPHDKSYADEIANRFTGIHFENGRLDNKALRQHSNSPLKLSVLVFDGSKNLMGDFVINDFGSGKYSLKDSLDKYAGMAVIDNRAGTK